MGMATILLVENDLVFSEIMERRLTKRRINVIAAYSGQEALELLAENERIEVVLLDDKIDGRYGFEILRSIRALFPLIEVIMFTGHAAIETAINGLNMGAFEYMMKLCDMEHLVEKLIEAAIQKRRHEEKIFQAKLKEYIPIEFGSKDSIGCYY